MNTESLIQQHKQAKEEVFYHLSELNKIDKSKLSLGEKHALKIAKTKLETEYNMRGIFINQLEDLEPIRNICICGENEKVDAENYCRKCINNNPFLTA